MLRTIDVAFCDEMNKEIQAYQDRVNEAHKADIEAARNKK